MTLAAPRPARVAGVAVLALSLLPGCAALTAGRDATARRRPRRHAAQYRVELDAPDELRQLLLEHLDLSRFQNAPDTEAIDTTELTRLAAAAPAQARALLETEGYFAAAVEPSRSMDAGGIPVVRVKVDPGPRSRIESVALVAGGELQTLAAEAGSPAAQLLAALQRDWPLPVGAPFRQPIWTAAKTTTLARVRAPAPAARPPTATHSFRVPPVPDAPDRFRRHTPVPTLPAHRETGSPRPPRNSSPHV